MVPTPVVAALQARFLISKWVLHFSLGWLNTGAASIVAPTPIGDSTLQVRFLSSNWVLHFSLGWLNIGAACVMVPTPVVTVRCRLGSLAQIGCCISL